MKKVRICMEIDGLSRDEQGNPCPCGLEIELGETEQTIDYKELTKDLDVQEILNMTFLGGRVKPENVRVITPEEYDERYGDEE